MDGIRILRRTLELKFKTESHMKQSRTVWFSQVLEGIKKGRTSFQKDMGRERRLDTFCALTHIKWKLC
jgi:hypothetical protein